MLMALSRPGWQRGLASHAATSATTLTATLAATLAADPAEHVEAAEDQHDAGRNGEEEQSCVVEAEAIQVTDLRSRRGDVAV